MNTYNTKLQTNNTNLSDILDKVNALPDAGEVGGGSGGAELVTGTFAVTDNGMYEPGVNEYILTNENLQASTRQIIAIYECIHGIDGDIRRAIVLLYRENLTDDFIPILGNETLRWVIGASTIEENTVVLYGELSTGENITVIYDFLAI